MAGGHSVEDDELKYGLAVSGIVDPDAVATNDGLAPGDELLLTKPLGTGVLATAVKARWEGAAEMEEQLYRWAGRLNKAGGEVIRALGLKAATDVTGFGLGGHLLEMARASRVGVTLRLAAIPMLDQALELAAMGMLPAGSHANRAFCDKVVGVAEGADQARVDLVFDAQTSGGLVLAVRPEQLTEARRMLLEAGDLAEHVGTVREPEGPTLLLE
jgi:selenide,water dikinase